MEYCIRLSKIACGFILCASACNAHGQQALEVGTQAGYQALWRANDQLNRASRAQYDDTWDTCTKIALPSTVIPAAARWGSSKLPAGFSSLDPSVFKEGAIGYIEHLARTTVVGILNDNEMIITFGGKHPTFVCLVDFPTQGRVDGESIRLIGPIQITGTRHYKDASNMTRTHRAIRLLTNAEVQSLRNAKD